MPIEQDPGELYGRLTEEARRNLVPFDPTPQDQGITRVMKGIAAGLLTSQMARQQYQQQADEYFRLSQHIQALKEEQKRAKEAHALAQETGMEALKQEKIATIVTEFDLRNMAEQYEIEKRKRSAEALQAVQKTQVPVEGTPEWFEMKRRTAEIEAMYARGGLTPDEAYNLTEAREQAKIDAMSKKPLSPSELKTLRHPDTLAPPAMGMTRGEAEEQGYIPVSPPQIQALNALTNTEAILDEIGTLANELITAKSWPIAAVQGASLAAAAYAKQNPKAVAYSQSRQSFIGVLSRTMGGERGVLTDRDIERIDKILPSFRDTKEAKDLKLQILRRILIGAKKAQTRNVFGFTTPEEMGEFRKNISTTLDAAETLVQAGGSPEQSNYEVTME